MSAGKKGEINFQLQLQFNATVEQDVQTLESFDSVKLANLNGANFISGQIQLIDQTTKCNRCVNDLLYCANVFKMADWVCKQADKQTKTAEHCF